eukprot:12965481-Alexandrium_andersonii.AAC.1
MVISACTADASCETFFDTDFGLSMSPRTVSNSFGQFQRLRHYKRILHVLLSQCGRSMPRGSGGTNCWSTRAHGASRPSRRSCSIGAACRGLVVGPAAREERQRSQLC